MSHIKHVKLGYRNTLLILFACFFFNSQLLAKPVSVEQVRKVADTFLKAQNIRRKEKLKTLSKESVQQALPTKFSAAGVREIHGDGGKVIAYVTVLEPEGFIITAADNDIRPILGYSFKGKFPFKDSKQNILLHLVQWDVESRLRTLSSDVNEIKAVAQSNNNSWYIYTSVDEHFVRILSGDSQTQWPPDKDGWLDTNWDQGPPYNNRCPKDPYYEDLFYRCDAGCVAIAMAQIINYWRYPSELLFSSTMDAYKSWSFAGTNLLNLTLKYREIFIDGDHDELDFPSFTELNGKLAYINYDDPCEWPYLCFAMGIKSKTNYSSDGSGAIANPLAFLWGCYYGSARKSWNEPIYNFYEHVQENIKKGWPVQLQIYGGLLGMQNGHSVVVDGYKESGEYHLNFGWSGTAQDTWYVLPDDLPDVNGHENLFSVVSHAIVDICPYPGWSQYGSDIKNTRRTRYKGPDDHCVKWIIDTHSLDSQTELATAIVGSGGNVYAFCKATNALDPGRLFVITPHGVVQRSIPIPAPAMSVSEPAQGSSIGLPIYIAFDNKVYKVSPEGSTGLFYEDANPLEDFLYPTQVDPNGNVYITGWDKMCSLDPNGQLRWSKAVPNSSAIDFSAGIAIDDERSRLYAKYYDADNDTAHLWALNRDTGAEIWDKPVSAIYSTMAAAGEPTIGADGTIFARFFKSIRAYNPDGSLKWNYQVNASQEYLEPFISLGYYQELYETLYICGTNYTSTPKYAWIRSIRASDKTSLWEFTKPYPSDSSFYDFRAPVVAYGNNMVYSVFHELASPGYRKLYALLDTGDDVTQVWEHEGAECILLGSTGAAYLLDRESERIIALSGGEVGNPDGAGMAFVNNSAPNSPANPAPANGEQNLDYAGEILFSWNCNDPDVHDLKYDVYLGAGGLLGLYGTGLTDSNCTVTGLRPGTGYLWKVVATDGQAVTEGPTWAFATKPAKPDLNDDGKVNFVDFAILANDWMNVCSEPNWCDRSDLDQSGIVDFNDLGIFVGSWLEQCTYEVVNLSKLTNGPIQESGPTFNADGTKIAYRYLHEPYAWHNCDIWVMNIDGSGKTQITTDSRGEFGASFVPDGRITYTKEFGSNDYNIWIVNPDGSNPQELIGGSYRQQNCRWYPNGNKIVYESEYQWAGPSEIWTANAEGTGQTQLTDHTVDGYGQGNPVYSRSGNLIAYANYATNGEQPHIWIMNADGSGKQQITSGTEGQNPMFWWPDDSRIGYTQNGELWLHNLTTGTDELLLAVSNGSIGWCDLSLDGAKVVFDLSDPSGGHIWIGDVVGN